MKKRKILLSQVVLSIVSAILAVTLLYCFAATIRQCSTYFDNQACSYSLKLTTDNAGKVLNNINSSTSCIKQISTDFSGASGFEQIDNIGESTVEKYGILCLQLYYEGNVAYCYGDGIASSSSNEVKSLIHGETYAVSKVFNDDSLGIPCVAMYSPVEGNPEIDCVIAFVTPDKIFSNNFKDNSLLKFFCIANPDGSIINSYSQKGFKTDVSHNIYTYLENLNRTKNAIPKLQNNNSNGLPSSYEISIENKNYVLSSTPVTYSNAKYNIFNIYEKSDLISSQYSLYNQLFAICTAAIIFSIIIICLYTFSKYNNINQLNKLDDIDPLIGCNSYSKFSNRATEILASNRHSGYAMVYFDINKFSFVREHFGSEICENILRQVSTIIDKILSDNETYGHVVDDRFAALMHCANTDDFTNRIKIISALLSNYQETKSRNFTLTMSIGVFKIERNKNYSIQEMLDRASIAEKLHKRQNSNEPFVMYDSNIRAAYLKEAEIESKMENSLKNNEFKVFYQPKYNIQNDCIDGAEALVRWYDAATNTYTSPMDFVPLFEVNGFIAKLDRYIFTAVCKFLHEMTERGEKTVPISINVSRVSATKYDFLSYYINTKRTYGIPDGFLMLEFTESFAYENYEIMNNIVMELRKNGFKCSIDDFGSGYSSFEILKKLPMDELKLDKLFLITGSDPKKDAILLKSIIQLGNNFDMKVTQEGVERIEQLRMLEEYGCNVIQGYYYSKPLPTSDFIEFIANNTSLDSVEKHLAKMHTF